MQEPSSRQLDDQEICLGYEEDLEQRAGAMMPPLVQTSLFAQENVSDLLNGLAAEHSHFVYSRGQNPTVQVLEEKLALLERGEACKCFASGMGAVSAVLTGLLESGDHVVFGNQIYGPTLQLAERLRRFGIQHSHVNSCDTQAILDAIQPNTKLLYLESPGTMLFRLLDIPTLVDCAHQKGVLLALDNSWATPLYQKPLSMGVDVVLHSCSKYIGGHSDVVAGAVISSRALMHRIFYDAFMLHGAIMAPFEAWLLIRSLRTLPLRMQAHQSNALTVARFLEGEERVRAVHHPALDAEQPGNDALTGYSGLFSIELEVPDFAALTGFIDGLRRFQSGVSWGGVESLVITPERGNNADSLSAQGLPGNLIRLSIGLEPAELLIEDLADGLAAL
jgi:cystathionine beta-lyase/cystathionine gamma-synthase